MVYTFPFVYKYFRTIATIAMEAMDVLIWVIIHREVVVMEYTICRQILMSLFVEVKKG